MVKEIILYKRQFTSFQSLQTEAYGKHCYTKPNLNVSGTQYNI